MQAGGSSWVAAARPDRTSVFLVDRKVAPRIVREVASEVGNSSHSSGTCSLVSELECSGPIAQLALSTTITGHTFLAAFLDSGLMEIWDVGAAHGSFYSLRDTVVLCGPPGEETSAGRRVMSTSAIVGGRKSLRSCVDYVASSSTGLSSALFFTVMRNHGGLPSGSNTPNHLRLVKLTPSVDELRLGSQLLSSFDSTRKKSHVMHLTCHESRPLLCVAFQDGVLHLYDISALAREDGTQVTPHCSSESEHQRGSDHDDEDDSDVETGQENDLSSLGRGASSFFSIRAARKLLLLPVAALKCPGDFQGALSSVSFSLAPELVIAGSTRGEVAVWSMQLLQRCEAQKGDRSLSLKGAALPLQTCKLACLPARIGWISFLAEKGPFLFACLQNEDHSYEMQIAVLLLLPTSIVMWDVIAPHKARFLAFQRRSSNLVLLEEHHDGDRVFFGRLAEQLSQSSQMVPSRLAAMGQREFMDQTFSGKLEGTSTLKASPVTYSPVPYIFWIQSRLTFAARQSDSKADNLGKITVTTNRKKGPLPYPGSFIFKAILATQTLESMQRGRNEDLCDNDPIGATFLLPTYGDEFVGLLSSLGVSDSMSLHFGLDDQTLLMPHSLLISPDASTIIVLSRILQPVLNDKRVMRDTGPLAYVVVRSGSRPCREEEENPKAGTIKRGSFCFEDAGITFDALFLSSCKIALLQPTFCENARKGSITTVVVQLQANRELDNQKKVWKVMRCTKAEDFVGHGGFKKRAITRLLTPCTFGASETGEASVDILCAAQKRATSLTQDGSYTNEELLKLTFYDAAGKHTDDANATQSLCLFEDERVIEVHRRTSEGQCIESAIFAVATSQRLMLLSADLAILACVKTYSKPCGLVWLGHTPVVSFVDGRVLYLSIDPHADSISQCGLRHLCSLKQTHAGEDSFLITALSDRLVYAAKCGEAREIRVLTRPLFPLEPLLLGLLAWPHRVLSTSSTAYSTSRARSVDQSTMRAGHIREVLTCFGPLAVPQDRYAPEEGPGATTGATSWTCAALSRAGYSYWASELAGVRRLSDILCDGEPFPIVGNAHEENVRKSRPWLSFAMTIGLAAQSSQWRQALVEATGGIIEKQDEVQQAGAMLPPRFRCGSHILARVGQRAWHAGQAEIALNLFDLAGEDEKMAELLLLHDLDRIQFSDDHTGLFDNLCDLNSALQWMRRLVSSQTYISGREIKQNADIADVVGNNLSSQIFPLDTQRRQSILTGLQTSHQNIVSWQSSSTFSNIANTALTPMPQSVGGSTAYSCGLARPIPARYLLLNSVEEWLGRAAPETLQDRVSGVSELDEDTPRGREDWVGGVGEGRGEEDNVILYLRFNDLNASPIPGDESSALLAQIGDLSQYGHTVSVAQGQPITCLESTCPIDQGDGVKVQMGMDAFWNSVRVSEWIEEDTPSARRGFSALIARGSALDVGPYHGPQQSPGRSRLTMEMWIQRPISSSTCSTPEILAVRRTLSSKPSCVWAFGVSADDALMFWTERCQTPLSTASGAVLVGKWTHVAFSLEIDASNSKQALVNLYVGGKDVWPAQLRVEFPSLKDSDLRRTVLEIGPNLDGHKMTEVRMWACARSAEALYDNRESYLQLAERKKKLTFKIRSDKSKDNRLGDCATATSSHPASLLPFAVADRNLGLPPYTSSTEPACLSNNSNGRLVTRLRGPEREANASRTWGDLDGSACGGMENLLNALPPPSCDRTGRQRSRRGSPNSARQVARPFPARSGKGDEASGGLGEASEPYSLSYDKAAAEEFDCLGSTTTHRPISPRPLERHLILLPEELDVNPANVMRDDMAGYFACGGRHLCFREEFSSTNENDQPRQKVAIVVLEIADSRGGPSRRDRYPFEARSAILVVGMSSWSRETEPLPSALIACYTLANTSQSNASAAAAGSNKTSQAGVLQVYDLVLRKSVARQPVQTTLHFWRWLDRGCIALVTQRSVFTWVLNLEGGSSRAPTKLFDRLDLSSSGIDSKVREYCHSVETGWGVLTTVDSEQCRLAIQFHEFATSKALFLTDADLLGANVCDCGVPGHGGNKVCLVLLRSAPALCVDLCTICEEGDRDNTQDVCLDRLVRIFLPSTPSRVAPAGRAWVVGPAGPTGVLSILFAAKGHLYTLDLITHEIQARGSVFPDGRSSVSDVDLDATSGDLLILDHERLAVFRISNL